MGFSTTLAKFARSPEGKRVFREASRLAKDPATRAKIQASSKSMQKGGGAKRR